METDTFHPQDVQTDRAEQPPEGQVLALPPPAAEPGAGAPQVWLGETVRMDHLGPLVVAGDGSLSRIANWAKLTEREREVALRRITARNRERLQRLHAEAAVQYDGTAAAVAANEEAETEAAAMVLAATGAGQQQGSAPAPGMGSG